MKKIGYVLSGGGARGFAHLGIIKLLEEQGLKPYAISGTSAGSIVGALYASGKGPEEIISLFKNNNLLGWSNLAWKKYGFFSMDVLRKLLNEAIEKDDFGALKIQLFVTATDLVAGNSVLFSKGKLIDAVIASSTVPVVFEPVIFDNKMLVDGSILNDFPVEPLSDICDIIIGSYVNKIEKGIGDHSMFKAIDILDRCFHLAIANTAYSKADQCDLFIEVPLHDFDMYDIKKADQIFEIGYRTALRYKEELLEFSG